MEHVEVNLEDPAAIVLDNAVSGTGTETPAKTLGRQHRQQRYRTSWEQIPELKDWLQAVEGDPLTAWCRHCHCGLTCHLKNLMVHAKSTKHLRRRQTRQPMSAPKASEGLGRGRCRPTAVKLTPNSGGTPEPDTCYGDADRVNYSIGLHNHTVGFVGGGCIAQAVLKGMLDKGIIAPGNVMVSAPSDRNLGAWRVWGCSTTQDNAEVVLESDLVLVAVKPQVAEVVFRGLGAALTDGRQRCFVSLVTGWSRHRITQTMASGLPEGGQETPFDVIRCVPNLSVSIGEGNSVYCCGDALSPRWLLAMETIFSALGVCQRSDELLMDAYSAAFSSGTAFVLSFIDALASGAVNLGVPWREALKMAAKTTSGAAQLVLDSGRTPSDLRMDASAPGGSTMAGSMALQKAGLEYSVMSAVQAAWERCWQLGQVCSPSQGPACPVTPKAARDGGRPSEPAAPGALQHTLVTSHHQ